MFVVIEGRSKLVNMRKHIAWMTVLIVAGAALLMAEFWDDRAFTEWNDKQVQRILEDSPWAQSTPVTLKGEARDGSGGGGGGRGRGMAIVGFGFQGRGGGLSIPQAPRPTMVVVRWESALPVRQALARMQFRGEVETSDDAVEYLSRTPTSYVVRIVGIPARGDLGTPESLMAGARLTPRNADPIQAIQAQVDRAGRGVDLFLAFPKEPPAGHVFTEDDRNVQLELSTDTIELRHRFNLRDMVYQGKLEM